MTRVSVCCGAPPFGEVEDTCDHCREHATFEEESDVDRPNTDSQRGPGAGRQPAGVPGEHLAESLKALSAALDEPAIGGKSMRDLLAPRRGERA